MDKEFEKIIEKLEKQIMIEEGIAKEESDGHPITHQYAANCMKVIEKFVKQEAEQFGTDTNVGSNGWIPFVHREMTEDKKESFGDFNFMLDCQLPDEDEEILVTYKLKDELYVDVDTFMRYGSECYLDSGRDFVTEAVAWMKKPQPYQPKGE